MEFTLALEFTFSSQLKFYELFSISMESTLSQTGTKRKRGIADGYKKFAWFSQAR